jgi:hypothetical protein
MALSHCQWPGSQVASRLGHLTNSTVLGHTSLYPALLPLALAHSVPYTVGVTCQTQTQNNAGERPYHSALHVRTAYEFFWGFMRLN